MSTRPLSWFAVALGAGSRDVRIGLRRTVRGGTGLAITFVGALASGLVGAVFAVAAPYTVRPLPYADPDALLVAEVGGEGLTSGATLPTLDDWRTYRDTIKGIATTRAAGADPVDVAGTRIPLSVQTVTRDFFKVLGVPGVALDRWHRATDSSAVPVLLTPSGRRVLPPEATRLGSLLRRDKEVLVVAGHLPDAFLFPDPRIGPHVDAIAPDVTDNQPIVRVTAWRPDGRPVILGTSAFIVRAQAGVTAAGLRERLSTVLPSGRRLDVRVERLSDRMTANGKAVAWGALGAGVLILLISAGNAANLSVVEAMYRSEELRVRAQLGASRRDFLRAWAGEYVVVTGLAATIAVLLTASILMILRRTLPGTFFALGAPDLTLRTVAFTVGCAAAVTCIGSVAAMIVTLTRALTGQESKRVGLGRVIFLGVQSGLAMILAVGAGMLIESYFHLITQDTGIDRSSGTVTVHYGTTIRASPDLPARIAAAIDRLMRVPGIVEVGASGRSIGGQGVSGATISVEGGSVFVETNAVSTGYFAAAGMTMREGRVLQASDGQWRGVVVNDAFVRAFLRKPSAVLGTAILHGPRQAEIVGVVRDALDRALDHPAQPTVYSTIDRLNRPSITYVLSPGAAMMTQAAAVRRALEEPDERLVIGEFRTIGDWHADGVRDRTFATVVLSCFGLAGIGVSIAGLVTMVAFVVTRRTREIAVRIALGARPNDIRRLVLREAAAATFVGAGLGVLIGRWMCSSLEHLVYGLEAGNWQTTLVAAGVALVVTLAAGLWPTQRAVTLSPNDALRLE